MSTNRKAGDLCPIRGIKCYRGDCVHMNQCMSGLLPVAPVLPATSPVAPFSESARRKASPVWSGVLNYFPDALLAVSRVSLEGNRKHNPGQPLHWSRDKSNDHLDCAGRHLLTPFAIDPDSKEVHLANAAWRILAELQLYCEKQRAKD